MAYVVGEGIFDDPGWFDWLRSVGVPIDTLDVTGVHIHIAIGGVVRVEIDTLGDTRLHGNPPPRIDQAAFLRIYTQVLKNLADAKPTP